MSLIFLSLPPPKKTLTLRQEEILRHIDDGLTYRDVAEQLLISETTVKYHMKEIRKRLHLKNRPHAVAYFVMANRAGSRYDKS